MNFLEASRLIKNFVGGKPQSLLLAMSGTSDQLEFYLRAHAVRHGLALSLQTLPFGTLGQHLHFRRSNSVPELVLLLPWDFVPECDWRTGMRTVLPSADSLLDRAKLIAEQLSKRTHSRFVYISAPIPPVCGTHEESSRLENELTGMATRLSALILSVEYFSMSAYLASGCPVAGTKLSSLAQAMIDLLVSPAPSTFKVIATDADNTLWCGVVGEDGVDAVMAEPQGIAFKHFIYQGFLARLKSAGILLAIISRNDEDMVRAPLTSGRMPLCTEDFVSIRAGYGAKSALIKGLATDLNLGVESIVFIDDNPVELAEITSSLPAVSCHRFPSRDDDLPDFLNRLAKLFSRSEITEEDKKRTDLYRRRLISQPLKDSDSLDIFLRDLEMVLKVRVCAGGDILRAHQLINKTNQFNLNGVKWENNELKAVLDGGGKIVTGTLEDRTGSHGEILACLIDSTNVVRSLVMSCRVFERRVEFAFLSWILKNLGESTYYFAFVPTERNEPIKRFLKDPSFSKAADFLTIDVDQFIDGHSEDFALFDIKQEVNL